MTATFIGVGVGPGDPELITLKAARTIQNAEVVSFLTDAEHVSTVAQIASDFLDAEAQTHLPVPMPMSTDRSLANRAYDTAATQICAHLNAGRSVVFLCEGDPLFFGSFSYLLQRLKGEYPCEVIPGISSVHAASAALQTPLTQLKESFAVVSGRHSDAQIYTALTEHDTVVIMKAGVARQRILKILAECGRAADAQYLEYIGREEEKIETDVQRLADEAGPYFSLFVVSHHNRAYHP